MYRTNQVKNGSIPSEKNRVLGEDIRIKMARILNNKEPISDGVVRIYTKRSDGVLPDYNPRTDKYDAMLDAQDAVAQAKIAKRDGKIENMKIESKNQSEGNSAENNAGDTGN